MSFQAHAGTRWWLQPLSRGIALCCAALVWVSGAACSGDSHASNIVSPTQQNQTPVPPPGATKSNVLYGVHSDVSWYTDSAYRAQTIAAAQSLHVQVVRLELPWEWVEYTQNHRNWTIIDDIVNQLTAAGIQPLFEVDGSPSWATGVSEQVNDFYLYVPTDSAAFHTWVSQYANFISAAARRYAGKVTMWEIGNEPNDGTSWLPAPNVGQYAAWYVALRSAIKTANPSALVAVGGLDGLGYNLDPPGIRGTTFLTELYTLHVSPDVVAIHPYSNLGQSPDVDLRGADNFDDIDTVHKLMVSNGHGSTPLWVTEWGWSVDQVTATQQATYLGQSLARMDSLYATIVTVATYYSEFDPASTYHYGLYTANLTERPAATTFRNFMSAR